MLRIVAALATLGAASAQAGQCSITSLFHHLTVVRGMEECREGYGGDGDVPAEWFPSQADTCTPTCGRQFEIFWDECREVLLQTPMDGVSGLAGFYDNCFEVLYPPGTCGLFCNEHTYECLINEVHESCCDEEGANCVQDSDVPLSCPVGCALVFPAFLETCHEHIEGDETMNIADFETFSAGCLEADGLELVEYLLDLEDRGCTINWEGGGNRRQMQFLSKWLDSPADECAWDDLDDKAATVDEICCADGSCGTPDDPRIPEACNPPCAIAMHDFHDLCHEVTEQILGDRHAGIEGFEQQCLSDLEANGEAIIEAIRTANCHDVELGTGEEGR